MAPVFKIMITCPVTRKAVETGIKTTSREALSSGLVQEHVVVCQHCHQVHSWNKEDAFLEIDRDRLRGELWRPNEA